jgi:hypothetical protein
MQIIKPLILSLLSVCIAGAAFSQSLCKGSLGDPVVNITFGNGDNPGGPLSTAVPGASTTLQYVSVTGNPAQPTPFDGQYTITNNVPFNGAWFSGAADHTTGNGNGYMAFYNSSENPGEFYSQTISNLCGATTYEFAAWIANALNPAMIVGVNPDSAFLSNRQTARYWLLMTQAPSHKTMSLPGTIRLFLYNTSQYRRGGIEND